jgi:GTP cyclohydrolase II
MTNNPRKIEQLQALGTKVSGRIPHVIPATEFNRFYLETKAARSGHLIEFEGKPHLPEQDDPVIVEK